ncbi:MAG: DUF3854 domain-containing protein [Acidobacteriaceae bacterium]
MSLAAEVTSLLHPDDLADLRRSGLSDGTIASMGCYSADATVIRDQTGIKKIDSPGYCIPYDGITNQTGQPYVRWRLRHPVEKVRYVAALGDDPQLYTPPDLASLPKSDLLVITEGEKKASKAVQEGIHCIAIQGVWSWCDAGHRAQEKSEGSSVSVDTPPITALIELANKYERVLVLGDSDLDYNPKDVVAWSCSQRPCISGMSALRSPAARPKSLETVSLPKSRNKGWMTGS